MHLRIAAGLLATVICISSVPSETFLAAQTAELNDEYISAGSLSFTAGAHAAINDTIVLNDTEDSVLADGETAITENDAPVVADPGAVEPEATEPEVQEGLNLYGNVANIGITTDIQSYLNVRQEPSAQSATIGKIYQNGAAIVLENLGEWLKIESGSMVGFVNAKYLIVGDEALCRAASTITAKITTDTLRVRAEASVEAEIIALLSEGKTVSVVDESIPGWLKIQTGGKMGYISSDYAEVSVKYNFGESKAEEAARVAEEAARREEANRAEAEAWNNKVYNEPVNESAQALVDYALQFVGNRYVWGGTSLTNGVDCSGFVMKIYEKFGYDLPHSSYELRYVGRKVSESEMQPGDIVCYSGHVAIYIGGGKIVHASNRKDGIKISNRYNYTKVICVRRVLP